MEARPTLWAEKDESDVHFLTDPSLLRTEEKEEDKGFIRSGDFSLRSSAEEYILDQLKVHLPLPRSSLVTARIREQIGRFIEGTKTGRYLLWPLNRIGMTKDSPGSTRAHLFNPDKYESVTSFRGGDSLVLTGTHRDPNVNRERMKVRAKLFAEKISEVVKDDAAFSFEAPHLLDVHHSTVTSLNLCVSSYSLGGRASLVVPPQGGFNIEEDDTIFSNEILEALQRQVGVKEQLERILSSLLLARVQSLPLGSELRFDGKSYRIGGFMENPEKDHFLYRTTKQVNEFQPISWELFRVTGFELSDVVFKDLTKKSDDRRLSFTLDFDVKLLERCIDKTTTEYHSHQTFRPEHYPYVHPLVAHEQSDPNKDFLLEAAKLKTPGASIA